MPYKKWLTIPFKGEYTTCEIHHIIEEEEEERGTKTVAIVGHLLRRPSRVQFIYLTVFLLPGTL